MSAVVVEVSSQVTGLRMGEPAFPSLLVELFDEQVTVGELIRRAVLEQIQELLVRRRIDAERAREMLRRQYLTDQEIDRQTEAGKIALPGKGMTRLPAIDGELEVGNACRAFERGAYAVFVDGRQVTSLDEIVCFRPNSKILFLRTVPLVGG